MNDYKLQAIADDLTHRAMLCKYGDRFNDCEDLDEDPEMNGDWEWLNDKFYLILEKLFDYETH